MQYKSTIMEDAVSVDEIYTVLRPNLTKISTSRSGESHPFPEIIYLTRGKHEVLIDGIAYRFGAGQMIIYAPNAYHEGGRRPTEDTEAAILTFQSNSTLLPKLYNRVITLSTKQRHMLSSIVDEGMQYFCGCAPASGLKGMQLREGITTQNLWGLKKQIELFLIDVSQTDTHINDPISKDIRWDEDFSLAVDWLQKHLCEPLTLAKIANGCSMSVSKLKLLFREKAGSGPIEFSIRLRIERAQDLIREGKLNFTEISEQLGFSSLHYFSRQFKKHTNLSPREYARKYNLPS